jgi:hypothetical protein
MKAAPIAAPGQIGFNGGEKSKMKMRRAKQRDRAFKRRIGGVPVEENNAQKLLLIADATIAQA